MTWKWDYTRLRLRVLVGRADLRGANLEGADLRGADLEGANLRGAYLRGADLEGADLRGAYLRGAYLRGAYLRGADLRGANLEGADLEGADLEGADLRGAYLRGADLEGADLRGAIGIIAVHFAGFDIFVQVDVVKIGCQSQSLNEWLNVTDEQAEEMGANPAHLPAYRLLVQAAHDVLKTLEGG